MEEKSYGKVGVGWGRVLGGGGDRGMDGLESEIGFFFLKKKIDEVTKLLKWKISLMSF